MTITKEIRKELKNWGYKVESESPLKLVPIIDPNSQPGDHKEVLIGIPAMIIVKDAMRDLNGGELDLDLTALDSMDDDAYLLVTANVNYADEFDMSEWTTMTVGDFKELADSLKEYESEISWYFGSNEEMQFSDGQDLLNQLTFKAITTEEYDTLDSLFGGSFGDAGVFEHINELDSEQDGENDEEAEEMVGILDSSELKKIEKLKLFGWTIEVYDEDEYLLEYKNTNGDYALTGTGVIDDLVEYHKRNK